MTYIEVFSFLPGSPWFQFTSLQGKMICHKSVNILSALNLLKVVKLLCVIFARWQSALTPALCTISELLTKRSTATMVTVQNDLTQTFLNGLLVDSQIIVQQEENCFLEGRENTIQKLQYCLRGRKTVKSITFGTKTCKNSGMVLLTWIVMCALFGKECYNWLGLSYRPQPSVTMFHIHNLCTFSCPRLLKFPFRPRQLLLNCITDTNYSWLIRIRGSHEEALGFHGTLPRIAPWLRGSSLIKDTNTPCEILPVVSTVSQVMRLQDP